MQGEEDDWGRQESCDDGGEPDEAERKAAEFERKARKQPGPKQPPPEASEEKKDEG